MTTPRSQPERITPDTLEAARDVLGALGLLQSMQERVLGPGSVLDQVMHTDEHLLPQLPSPALRSLIDRARRCAEGLRRLRAEPLYDVWYQLHLFTNDASDPPIDT